METFTNFIDLIHPTYSGIYGDANIAVCLLYWDNVSKNGICVINGETTNFAQVEAHTFVIDSKITFKLPPNYRTLMISKCYSTEINCILELE